jgi:multidrug resistance protein
MGTDIENPGMRDERKVKEDLQILDSRSAEESEEEEEVVQEDTASSSHEEIPVSADILPEPEPDIEALNRVPSSRPLHTVFGRKQRLLIVFMASFGGFFSPLSANIYFPALPAIAKDLQVSNELVNLTLTSYMIFQGLAPAFMGDFADVLGRRPVYLVCFVIYIGACIGIALQDNYAALMVLRCLQSTGSSATIALAYGVVADISSSSQRGTYMSFASMGAMLGPALGPTLGGALSQYLGWRSIFWFLAILAIVYLIFCAIALPETGRNVVGNGSIPPPRWNMSVINYYQSRKIKSANILERTASQQASEKARADLAKGRKFKFPNPLKALHIIFQKDAGILILYNSLVYTAFYCVITSIPQLFSEIYSFNDFQIGLCFLPFGFGCVIASLVNGRILDYNYRRVAKKAGIKVDKKRGEDMRRFPIERARLPVVFPLLYSGMTVLIVYGWVLHNNGPLPAVLVLLFFIGLLCNGSYNSMNTLLVDLFPKTPATAIAANNLARCWMGAGGTAIITLILNALGRGWTFTLVGLLVIAASPMPWILLRWGPAWREERWIKNENHEKEKAEQARLKKGTETSNEKGKN